MRRLGLAALSIVIAACGTTASAAPSPSPSPSRPGPSVSGSVFPESPVDGVVIDVDRTSLVDVQNFTIRAGDGRTFEFRVGPLENPTEFPPSHLAEHQADGAPVRVTFHVEGTDLVATRLDDAP